jgi:senataxin
MKWFQDRLNVQLGQCDVCIINYYQRKIGLHKSLLEEGYEEETVTQFFEKIDAWDVERIHQGLISGHHQLNSVGPKDRTFRSVAPSSLLAIYEVLANPRLLRNEKVGPIFKEVFKLIQTNSNLNVVVYVPALIKFLFESDELWRIWALKSLSKIKKPPTAAQFEWAIQDPLTSAMYRVSAGLSYADTFLRDFWCGMTLIVGVLDKNRITHSLRGLSVDIYKLALEHLQYDSPILRFILQTITSLLTKSPTDFWDAYGVVTPVTIIEQIFSSPWFDKFLKESNPQDRSPTSALQDMIGWVEPFMNSLKLQACIMACKTLVTECMKRVGNQDIPPHVRFVLLDLALNTLSLTIKKLSEEAFTSNSGSHRASIVDAMQIVEDNIGIILTICKSPRLSSILGVPQGDSELQSRYEEKGGMSIGLRLIKFALALDCRCVQADHLAILTTEEVDHDSFTYSRKLWESISKSFDYNSQPFARAVFGSITALIGLEKFKVERDDKKAAAKRAFNLNYGVLTSTISHVLNLISEYDATALDPIFETVDTANSALSCLFSPENDVQEAALNIIKQLSNEISRQDAISHLLKAKNLKTTSLFSMAWALRRVAKSQTFSWNPGLLKVNNDVLDVLCNSQDGLLRIDHFPSKGPSDVNVVASYWDHLWLAVRVIFETTEKWGTQNTMDQMRDFARDTIEFAERLFDQYPVFQAALDSMRQRDNDSVEEYAPVAEELLEKGSAQLTLTPPTRALESMVKWLRLKDEYLLSILTNLVCSLLRRLGQNTMPINEETLEFITGVALTKKTKSILTEQQKAELVQSLKQNRKDFKVSFKSESEKVASMSQSKITKWSGSGAEAAQTGAKPTLVKREVIDLDKWRAKAIASKTTAALDSDDFEAADSDLIKSLSSGVERLKKSALSQQLGMRPSPTGPSMIEKHKEAQAKAFKEKRQKEQEEKRLRDQRQIALLKPKARPVPAGAGGTGLLGLGVKGKEHSVPNSNAMMLSDDSGSSSDSDDEPSKFRLGSTRAAALLKEKRDGNLKALRRPVQKIKQVRSLKDTRARLAPDLTKLHKVILEWDLFADSVLPPNAGQDDYRMVTSTFSTARDYQQTFEPLLALECWQSFQKAKEEDVSKPFEITIANRMTVDSFIEVNSSISLADCKAYGIGESDIILISKGSTPMSQPDQPHCLARIHSITRKKAQADITYRINQGNSLTVLLTPKAVLYGVRIGSLTPLEREYGALVGLQYYDLCEEVLEAKPSPILEYAPARLKPLQDIYKLNSAQAKAVASAMDNDAFTLIQGPPGSGKTKTIVAIVGALLTSVIDESPATVVRAVGQASNDKPNSSKKLLVCAPSNAAVDELVMRFKTGIITKDGIPRKANVLRIGRSEAINLGVLDVTLEEIVKRKMQETSAGNPDIFEEIHTLVEEHKAKSEKLNELRTKFEQNRAKGVTDPPELQREFDQVKRDRTLVGGRLDKLRDKQNTRGRDAEIARRKIQQEVLDESHIICATLSGSGHEMMRSLNVEFETVIIDEAAQSIELSALIPLKYGCSKCILVGDPKQLPPTVLSREASKFQYEQSLFVRMQLNHPQDIHLLDVQYRMHPDISLYPSKTFYDGKLLDGPDMALLRHKPWHSSSVLAPYRFFDVKGRHQTAKTGHSLVNYEELDIAMALYHRLITDFRSYDFEGKVGIITPYKSQLRELRNRFAAKYGENIFKSIEFNTTDAFQGRESEIIIFSCVRAAPSGGIGFLSDIRRMNVGLTRAKSSLWVLGNSDSLVQGQFWKALVEDAMKRDRYTSGDLRRLFSRPLEIGNVDVPMIDYAPTPPKEESPPVVEPVKIKKETHIAALESANPKPLKERNQFNKGDHPITPTAPITGNSAETHSQELARPICTLCESFDHSSGKCNEPIAGRCWRCGSSKHSYSICRVPRCDLCGKFGQDRETCKNKQKLPQKQALIVMQDEAFFDSRQKANHASQRSRNPDEHDPQVPVVRVGTRESTDSGDGSGSNAPGKRKREENDIPHRHKKPPEHRSVSNVSF